MKKKSIMKVYTPIALVCYEETLPLPISSPLMHNQLSNLTYLPEVCEAHEGRGEMEVQKVPICRNFLQDRFSECLEFLFVLTLIDIVGPMCAPCTMYRRAGCQSSYSPTHTPLHLLVLSCTHTQGGESTKGK